MPDTNYGYDAYIDAAGEAKPTDDALNYFVFSPEQLKHATQNTGEYGIGVKNIMRAVPPLAAGILGSRTDRK